MIIDQIQPTVDQRIVRGGYERYDTDTAALAAELSARQDLGLLVSEFDKGFTSVRDVSGMSTAMREAILKSDTVGTSADMLRSHRIILASPVENLHRRVVHGVQDQPIGHNFFANASGFLDANFPWARRLDDLLRARSGYGIYDIADSEDSVGKDELLAGITEDPDDELIIVLATYLAGRSLTGERYLLHHYGDILEEKKADAYAITAKIARDTGLRIDMLERAAAQIHRTTFGSFDHLAGLVTSYDTGTNGDYVVNSLRIQLQFDGENMVPEFQERKKAKLVTAHELQHAGSAQFGARCGLMSNGRGIEANEGMTEFLAQLSTGNPGIIENPSGLSDVMWNVSYRAPVFTALALYKQFNAGSNNHFAVLFNAYHGDVRSQSQLEESLDAFYDTNVYVHQNLR